ncbi:MAG: hypothetical protein R3D60_09505 [Paracoccaceae bacterium]
MHHHAPDRPELGAQIRTSRLTLLMQPSPKELERTGSRRPNPYVQPYVVGLGFVVPQSVIEAVTANGRRTLLAIVAILAALVALS